MSRIPWIRKMDKSDWLLLGIYYTIAFLITFFAEWSEENIPLFSSKSLPLLFYMIVGFTIDILAVIVIVFWIFNKFFPAGNYWTTFVLILVVLMVQYILQTLALPIIYGPIGPDFITSLLWGIIDNFTALAPIGLFLMAKQYYSSQNKFLELERNQKDHELKLLKAQVDPHFLFNNLNILDILIQTDPVKASEFTKRLSSLYRYMIRHRNEELVSLTDEWQFSADYIYLLQQRFDGLFEFDIQLPIEELSNYYIPPASIQTLLENVVKHNVALPSAPLTVRIYLEAGRIIVSNSVQLKEETKDSMGSGLSGLDRRVTLLTDQSLIIEAGKVLFTVKIPLLNKIQPQ